MPATDADNAKRQQAQTGPNNDITDVPGIQVGNAIDEKARTGVSVVIPNAPAICACDVRGGGPGTRETDLLSPSTLVETVDAIALSGGSTYGLAAADGVAARLGANGRGFQLVASAGVPPSPIVPSAILYDLANGGDKQWRETPPYRQLGLDAAKDAEQSYKPLLQGKSGAGFGALAGDGPGGLGSASVATADGFIIGALMAVNSFGSVKMPGGLATAVNDTPKHDVFWAWPFEINGEFGGARPSPDCPPAIDFPGNTKMHAAARANTTIGVVAVNAAMSQATAQRIAIMAQDGIARAIRPVHGPTDGDVLFVLATGGNTAGAETSLACQDPLTITRIGLLAADCVARAIARGVYEAERH